MTIAERQGNIFDAPDDFIFAHCISADFALGAGLTVQSQNRLGTRDELREKFRKYAWAGYGTCILTKRTLNLITKQFCYEKPSYENLWSALCKAKAICETHGYKKLAMPRIGCGIDGLNWLAVKSMVEQVFADTDVEIVVYYL
jgi:hypothetical protein